MSGVKKQAKARCAAFRLKTAVMALQVFITTKRGFEQEMLYASLICDHNPIKVARGGVSLDNV